MNHYNYKGTVYTITELSEMSGIARATLRDRFRRGYSVEQAIRMVPTSDSVEQFNESSHWEDWVGMPINDLYQIYWKWCVSHEFTPTPIQGFSRHLFALNPWLRTVPNRSGNRSYRVIRKRD
jgi:hypothetical protein